MSCKECLPNTECDIYSGYRIVHDLAHPENKAVRDSQCTIKILNKFYEHTSDSFRRQKIDDWTIADDQNELLVGSP